MKFLPYLFLPLLFLITACTKEDTAPTYSLKFKLDGVLYESSETGSEVNVPAFVLSGAKVNSTGTTDWVLMLMNSTTIQYPYNGVGTYEIAPLKVGLTLTMGTSLATYNGVSGTITVSEQTDTYMKGTFSASVVNSVNNTTKSLTEGTFISPLN